MNTETAEFDRKLRSILDLKASETEKLARAFALVTGRIIEGARRDIELAQALGDMELKVKHQIKMETIETARQIFQMCHRRVTGRSAWDE